MCNVKIHVPKRWFRNWWTLPESPVQKLCNAPIVQFAFLQRGFPCENKTSEIEESLALKGEDDLPLPDLPPRFWNLEFFTWLCRNLGLTVSSFQNQKAVWHTALTVELPNLLVFEESAQSVQCLKKVHRVFSVWRKCGVCSVFEESVESVQFDGSTLQP